MSKKLGAALKQAREKSELSQMELAKALGYVSPQFVSNWERGLCSLPLRKVTVFCKKTGMRQSELQDLLIADSREEIEKRFRPKKTATATK